MRLRMSMLALIRLAAIWCLVVLSTAALGQERATQVPT